MFVEISSVVGLMWWNIWAYFDRLSYTGLIERMLWVATLWTVLLLVSYYLVMSKVDFSTSIFPWVKWIDSNYFAQDMPFLLPFMFSLANMTLHCNITYSLLCHLQDDLWLMDLCNNLVIYCKLHLGIILCAIARCRGKRVICGGMSWPMKK
jgi:hypothetical protein